LNGIRNGAFYLKRKSEGSELWESDARFPKFFGLIEDEIHKAESALSAQASIDHILPRALEPQLLEVGVRRALDEMDLPPHVTLETDFDQSEPTPVWSAEVALLTRCLVENALDAVAEQTSAVIRVATRSKEGGAVWLTVQDDGPGMEPQAVAAATQAFRTDKPGRHGIGLNVASRIASRNAGELRVEHPDGGGLRVEARLS
jgi:C4-dicarboxylate-specific signal transduction histidine kinase